MREIDDVEEGRRLVRIAHRGSGSVVTWRRAQERPQSRFLGPLADRPECHRADVMSVLGAHDVEVPGLDIGEDLDVWHHGIATGMMRES